MIMVRHGRKVGEDIAEEQIAEIKENGIPVLNDLAKGQKIVFQPGGTLDRTRQTLAAFAIHLDQHPEYGHEVIGWLAPNPAFGNEALFNKMLADADAKAEAAKTSWYTAFDAKDQVWVIDVQMQMFTAIQNLFRDVNEDTLIISVGHSPLIEWLGIWLDKFDHFDKNLKLQELTGFILTEECGQITITGFVGF